MQRPYGVRRRKNHKHFVFMVFMTIGEFFLCPIPPDLILPIQNICNTAILPIQVSVIPV